MADAVALGINPPNFDTLNSILGIKQKQQQLQSQALEIQGAQAGLVGKQQSAKETQGLAQLLSDPVGNGILEQDGQTPAAGAQQRIMQVAPTTGAQHYDAIVKAAQSKVSFNQSLNSLNAEERTELGSTVAGAAAGAKSPEEANAAIDNLIASKQGLPVQADYQRMGDIVKKMIQHGATQDAAATTPIPIGKEAWRNSALSAGRQVLGAAGVVGAGGISLPQASTNAQGQNVVRNPLTGDLNMPGGNAPNPPSSEVAGKSARQVATGNADVDRSNQVGALLGSSATAIQLTQQADRLRDEIDSGHLAKKISEGGNYLGFSSVNDARAQLNQDLGKMKGLVADRAGSDSRAATMLEGYPSDTTPPNTFHADMDYLRGTARQNLARGKLLQEYQKTDPQGLRGFQAADNIMTSSTTPLMHEYLALKPSEQAGFYRRNFQTPTEAQAFKDQVNALKKHTSVLD